MIRAGAGIAPALRLLGLAAVLYAVWRGAVWALIAALGGVLLAFGLTLRSARTRALPSLDFAHLLDLVRRAEGAVAAWGVGLVDGPIEAVGEADVPRPVRDRGAAIVQLASVDGRAHVVRESEGAYVAVGDFPYGVGVLLAAREAAAEATDGAVVELRRLVATMRLAERGGSEVQGELVARRLAQAASGAQTLEGVARAAADLAQQLTQRGAAVARRDEADRSARVLAVSAAVDQRLAGLRLDRAAPVVRAIETALPVVAHGVEDVFGVGVPERRRRERAGTAYPLLDGHRAIGALVIVGPPLDADGPAAGRIARLVAELGPRLAAALAVHEAEQRAIRDPLTGLSNRREFEQVLGRYRGDRKGPAPPATLVYVDLDRFKRLNDSLGHAAGDSALRHVARLLEAAVRDGDLVARIGGEEFAVWLPRTPLAEGLEVAERIRQSVANTTWQWGGSGSPYPLTTSCGVAAYPEPIGDLTNLRTSADAALYRAKQAGRNRVEMAIAGH